MSSLGWHSGLNETVRYADDHTSSPWECAECGAPVPFLRGVQWGSQGIFAGWCVTHGGHAHYIFTDGSYGFCCADCRLQRDAPDDESTDPSEEKFVWRGYCGNCADDTSTAKIDASQPGVWVCGGCRTELDEPDDVDEVEECEYCGEETYTVEIGT